MRIVCLPLLLAVGCGGAGEVEPDCEKEPICRKAGRCSALGASCAALTDADCRVRSEVCVRFGLCTPSGEAGCIATRDVDCKASGQCQIYGGCRARDGRCLALSDEDCAGSSACKQYGWCTANESGDCVKVGS